MRDTRKPGRGDTHVARRIKMLLALAAACALTACGSSGDGASTAVLFGTSAINLSGGDSAATGGNGGTFSAYSSARSDLKIHASGSVDASFVVPAYTPSYGGHPLTVDASTTVTQRDTDTIPGGLYLNTTDSHLYLGNGDGNLNNDTAITGLIVNPGVTLQLPDNATVIFSDAVVVSGTVTTATAQQNLTLTAGSLLQVNLGGTITTAPPATQTGNGGVLALATTSGVFINAGTITSSGATGSAGALSVAAKTFIYNTGTISAKGSDNAGGAGGSISLFATTASVLSSGIIDASGGKGATGGKAGAIQLVAGNDTVAGNETNGKVAVSGTVSANGGDATTGAVGNDGGTIALISHGQPLLVNAVISAVGGKGGTGTGGKGGELHLRNLLSIDPGNNITTSPQGIKVGGPISLNGGSGGQKGGDGGTISAKSVASPNALPGSAAVEFFGYGFGINLSGGQGKATGSSDAATGTGGAGGIFSATLASAVTDGVTLPAGGVYNEVTITARGGDSAATLTGGAGGTVLMQTPVPGSTANVGTTVISNSGPIDVSGGAGNIGGAAGGVAMIAYDKVTNSGAITATGGTGTSQGGKGAQALPPGVSVAGIYLHSTYGTITNSGAIVTTGGSGPTGGMGGAIEMDAGTQTVNSGAIFANGGNGIGTGTLTGGSGGTIKLFSQTLPTSNAGPFSVLKGTGTGGSPANGTFTIDGVIVI